MTLEHHTVSIMLVTGKPCCGKTTLIREIAQTYRGTAGGFFTEEIRQGTSRQGFKITTLDGKSAVLAHTSIKSPCRVSRYGVDTAALEEIAIPALHSARQQCDLIILDEIGKMELCSQKFQATVLELLDSGVKLLGSIMLKPNPFADAIKQDSRVRLITLDRTGYPRILAEIREWLEYS